MEVQLGPTCTRYQNYSQQEGKRLLYQVPGSMLPHHFNFCSRCFQHFDRTSTGIIYDGGSRQDRTSTGIKSHIYDHYLGKCSTFIFNPNEMTLPDISSQLYCSTAYYTTNTVIRLYNDALVQSPYNDRSFLDDHDVVDIVKPRHSGSRGLWCSHALDHQQCPGYQ